MSGKQIDDDWKNRVADERRQAEEAEAKRNAEAQESRRSQVPATFTNFLSEYAMRAMVLLGMIPYPGGEERLIDVGGARFTIDILGVIEEKSKGNRTKEEDAYLRNALYELRLRFVDVSEKVAAGTLKEGPQGSVGAAGGVEASAPAGRSGAGMPGGEGESGGEGGAGARPGKIILP
ncbi:MAG: DUF1844 domain-containing protein [Planctomycetota bacterium]